MTATKWHTNVNRGLTGNEAAAPTEHIRPDGVLAFFKGCLKKRVAREAVPAGGAPRPPAALELPDDPYA